MLRAVSSSDAGAHAMASTVGTQTRSSVHASSSASDDAGVASTMSPGSGASDHASVRSPQTFGSMGPRAGNPVHTSVVTSAQPTGRDAGASSCNAVHAMASGMGSGARGSIRSCTAGVVDAGTGGTETRLTRTSVAPGVVHAGAGGAVTGLSAVASGTVVDVTDARAIPAGLPHAVMGAGAGSGAVLAGLAQNAVVAGGDRVAVLVDASGLLLVAVLLEVRHLLTHT